MTLAIRPFRPEDEAPVARVWSLAFRGGAPLPADRFEERAGREIFVAEADGAFVGAYQLDTTRFHLRGRPVPSGAIRAVAVAPDSRQAGVGSAMMRHALVAMRERGHLLGVLHAVRESYYRRFGFESAGRRVLITSPIGGIPKWSSALPVRLLTLDDWEQVALVYATFAARYSGTRARDGFAMSRIHWLGDETPAQVVAVGTPVEAFAALRLKKGLHVSQEVCELAWATPEGYRALLGALVRIGFNGSTLTWPEPLNGPFLSLYYDPGVEMHLTNPPMYRLLDAPGLFSRLEAEGEGEFTLELEDEDLPENRGPWRVRFSPRGARVEPATRAQLRLHARQAVQALLGEPSLADLVAAGGVQIHDAAALPAALRLLPAHPTFCMDFF